MTRDEDMQQPGWTRGLGNLVGGVYGLLSFTCCTIITLPSIAGFVYFVLVLLSWGRSDWLGYPVGRRGTPEEAERRLTWRESVVRARRG